MDTSKTLIIAKGKTVTSDVVDYELNSSTNQYEITYKGGASYRYNAQNVTILQDPIRLNPQSYQIRHNGKILENITAIYVFKDGDTEYWHICCSNGHEYDYCKDEMVIDEAALNHDDTVIARDEAKQIIDTSKIMIVSVAIIIKFVNQTMINILNIHSGIMGFQKQTRRMY